MSQPKIPFGLHSGKPRKLAEIRKCRNHERKSGSLLVSPCLTSPRPVSMSVGLFECHRALLQVSLRVISRLAYHIRARLYWAISRGRRTTRWQGAHSTLDTSFSIWSSKQDNVQDMLGRLYLGAEVLICSTCIITNTESWSTHGPEPSKSWSARI